MTSLSRIIKSHAAQYGYEPTKVVGIKSIKMPAMHDISDEPIGGIPLAENVLREASEKANQIIMKAREEALIVKEEIEAQRLAFEEERQIINKKAYKEGFDAGFAEGKEQGRDEYKQMKLLMEDSAEKARAEYARTIEEAERTILELSMEVAEKIISCQLYGDEHTYLAFVRNAIKESREYKNIELHIHPAHYEHILQNKDELASLFPRETAFYIYPDEELSEGDCYIESSSGRLVASVDVQLAEIKKVLQEVLEEGQE